MNVDSNFLLSIHFYQNKNLLSYDNLLHSFILVLCDIIITENMKGDIEMRNFDGVVVKEGYELMLLMKTAYGNYYNAIIHRKAADDFVFCTNYDVTDGTWGQGHYCTKYGQALKEFARYLDI